MQDPKPIQIFYSDPDKKEPDPPPLIGCGGCGSFATNLCIGCEKNIFFVFYNCWLYLDEVARYARYSDDFPRLR